MSMNGAVQELRRIREAIAARRYEQLDERGLRTILAEEIEKILPLMEANFLESSPAPCKFVRKEMGLLEENLRLPLVPVTAATRSKLKSVMKEMKI